MRDGIGVRQVDIARFFHLADQTHQFAYILRYSLLPVRHRIDGKRRNAKKTMQEDTQERVARSRVGSQPNDHDATDRAFRKSSHISGSVSAGGDASELRSLARVLPENIQSRR
jgi:hypothetical protein